MTEADRSMPESWARGWDGHEQQQLLRLARLTLAEKLDWLEEAHRLVLHLGKAQRPERAHGIQAGLTARG
ncbi:MAG TPA: hypothetical protein VKI65_03180 [Gemmataceae bacterium]|nr:hypothetical protein [Gemmataceae bacterium]